MGLAVLLIIGLEVGCFVSLAGGIAVRDTLGHAVKVFVEVALLI